MALNRFVVSFGPQIPLCSCVLSSGSVLSAGEQLLCPAPEGTAFLSPLLDAWEEAAGERLAWRQLALS